MNIQASTVWHKVVLVLLVLGVGTFGTWLRGVLPDAANVLPRPFVRDGTDLASINSVENSKSPRLLTTPSGETLPATKGEYLVVDLDIVNVTKPTSYIGILVDASGSSYFQFGNGVSSCGLHQPGLTVPCTFVFEVPHGGVDNPVVQLVTTAEDFYSGEVIQLELPDG